MQDVRGDLSGKKKEKKKKEEEKYKEEAGKREKIKRGFRLKFWSFILYYYYFGYIRSVNLKKVDRLKIEDGLSLILFPLGSRDNPLSLYNVLKELCFNL
jgi:hypothetical protein